jgi:transposase
MKTGTGLYHIHERGLCMAQYTISSDYASIIAFDTHARTITANGIDLETGVIKKKRFNDCPSVAEIASWIEENFTAPHLSAYESGVTGFYLSRELITLGIDCDVIAVSSIARSTDDRQRKTDRMDANRLLKELLIPGSDLSRVWLPDPECEGVRDLLRCYRSVSDDLRRSKQQTGALLLRHGYVFNEKTKNGKSKSTWQTAFYKWLDTVDLGSKEANDTLAYYRTIVSEREEQTKRIMARIEEIATLPRWKPYVDAFCYIKGIEVYSAMVYAAEFGDFLRFKNGRSVSKWTGVTPKSHASGERQVVGGHITKAGNEQVRRALVEGCSSMARRKYAPVKLKAGRVVSEEVISICNQCNKRLIDRHRHLSEVQKKTANVAKIAIASEMIRWIWVVGSIVQQEQLAASASMAR